MIVDLRRNTPWLVGVAIIAVIILSIISSNVSIQYILGIIEPQTAVYDDKFIPSITKIANLIPKNETLVVSGSGGIITFFTDFPVKTPRNVTSLESLVQWMSKHNFNYLVVTPNKRTNFETNIQQTGAKTLGCEFPKDYRV